MDINMTRFKKKKKKGKQPKKNHKKPPNLHFLAILTVHGVQGEVIERGFLKII